jgi:hypothetical protein
MSLIRRILGRLLPINPNLRFVFLLLIFSVFYDYPSILLKRPQSAHHWRQSDCASLALNYYQTGMHFFQPQTHNLTSDNNTTGYCATSEIPIGYYFIACLYKVFGYHDFIYRFVNTFIFLLGLFYLFKASYLLFNDFFWSAGIALFLFTSPVLVYYGNNFLTDSSAFAFALIAWYFFIRYYIDKKNKYYYTSMLFFLIAGAYKITALLSFVAILILFVLEYLEIFKLRDGSKIFLKPLLNLIPLLLIIIIISSWIFFSKNYNAFHKADYFSTGILPVWDLDKAGIIKAIDNIKNLWLSQYFHVYALYFFAAAFLITVIFIKKANTFLFTIDIMLFIGTIIYAVLWFIAFQHHDYYTINLYILLVFILLNLGWILKSYLPKVSSSYYLKILFVCFLLFNMHHARKQIKSRYYGWWSEYPEYKDYHIISPYLRSIGIAPLDTVICLPDESHFTLYLMNQRGWTECMGYNSDSASIAASINNGAKYLIIDGDEIIRREYLHSFLNNPIGQFNKVRIYKLDK